MEEKKNEPAGAKAASEGDLANSSEEKSLSAGRQNVLSGVFDVDFSKIKVSIDDMFKNGVHFGHHKSRRNPKMNEFIFGTKNGINIFDLEKTAEKIKEAMEFIEKVISSKEDILFVGTKKQAKGLVELVARKIEMPFVTERWLGGTFTNFSVISARAKYLREGQEKIKKGEFGKYTKFEQMKIREELERLEKRMGGIKNMTKFPGAVFVTGVIEDSLAIKEARKRNIPIVAICDTNVNPDGVDYPIPANEDAVSSLRLLLTYMGKAVFDGKNRITDTEDKPENK